MKRGTNFVSAVSPNLKLFSAVFVGAGAADATLATDAQYPREDNLGLTMKRTSIGLFVVTLADCTTQVLTVIPEIVGVEGLWATVKVDVDPVAKTLTLNVWDPAGGLDDPETTDTVKLTIIGYDTSA